MTIRRGEEWGTVGPPPAGVVEVDDDAALHRLVNDHRSAGRDLPPLAPRSGDLFRALGGVSGQHRLADGADVATLPCDLVRVSVDGRDVWGAVHVVVRRRPFGRAGLGWLSGSPTAVMNAQFLGLWDVAPRAHPNDGRVDIVEVAAEMPVRQRLLARRRLLAGTHLPHPSLRTRQVREAAWRCPTGSHVWVDGVSIGPVQDCAVVVEPDALVVVV